jgi:hypothetical protein
MKWISFCTTIGFVALSLFAHADAPPSYRQQHPLNWMHDLPVGEQPGWSKPWWFNFEAGRGNVWNAPLTMTDKKSGKKYEYTADFEQTNVIMDFGFALSDSISAGFEIPFGYRDGGFMDGYIDDFHRLIGNRRFNRTYYPENRNIYSVKTGGKEFYNDLSYAGGVSNVKLKFKYWFLKWFAAENGSCPCGLAVSSQTKIPTQSKNESGTTGDYDQSFLLHVGIPLFSASSLWFTGGYTALGKNPAMQDWPRNNYSTLYEMNLDISISQNFGLILNARAESPFLKKSRLSYFDLSTNPAIISRNRNASGWSSLVNWRGSESAGIRYKTRSGNVVQVMMVEDWGIGSYDTTDNLYTNDAPDVNFVLQTQW